LGNFHLLRSIVSGFNQSNLWFLEWWLKEVNPFKTLNYLLGNSIGFLRLEILFTLILVDLMKASRSFSALSFSETINYFSFSTSAILTYPSNNSWRAICYFIKDFLALCSAAFTSFSNSSLRLLKEASISSCYYCKLVFFSLLDIF